MPDPWSDDQGTYRMNTPPPAPSPSSRRFQVCEHQRIRCLFESTLRCTRRRHIARRSRLHLLPPLCRQHLLLLFTHGVRLPRGRRRFDPARKALFLPQRWAQGTVSVGRVCQADGERPETGRLVRWMLVGRPRHWGGRDRSPWCFPDGTLERGVGYLIPLSLTH